MQDHLGHRNIANTKRYVEITSKRREITAERLRGLAVTLASLSQLVASGIKPTKAYVSLGYSNGGAPQSAHNLLKWCRAGLKPKGADTSLGSNEAGPHFLAANY
jgi:hypothetical protein